MQDNIGRLSVKSDRDYQIGLTWIDSRGRQTPVFTEKDANVVINKSNCDTQNTLRATAVNTASGGLDAPSWATHYKFYVKDNGNTYHNLAMDRFYFAEDGNIWLSFPSSERNKVAEGEYIILKKEHDGNTAIKKNNRYKILDISNEAPPFVRNKRQRIGTATISVTSDGTPYSSFSTTKRVVKFRGPTASVAEKFHNAFNDNSGIQFLTADFQTASRIYQIDHGGPTGEITTVGTDDFAEFVIKLEDIFDTTDSAFTTLGPSSFVDAEAIMYKDVPTPLPEFEGRFFVKVRQNSILRSRVISKVQDVTRIRRTVAHEIPVGSEARKIPGNTVANLGSGAFLNNLMPQGVNNTSVRLRVDYENAVNARYRNRRLDRLHEPKVHAGYDDPKAVNGMVNDTTNNTLNEFPRDFTIPGRPYSKPKAGSNEFSIGFVAGMANDFNKLYNNTFFNIFQYPNSDSPLGLDVPFDGYDTSLAPNNGLSEDQKRLHEKFNALKTGTQIRFLNKNGDAGSIFTILEAKEYYYLRGFTRIKDPEQTSAEVQNGIQLGPQFPISVGRKIDIKLDRPLSAGFTDGHVIQIMNFKTQNNGETFTTSNPAIFETEPPERADLDLYFEASDALAVSTVNSVQSLDFFNCFVFGNGVESDKIRDDFNGQAIGKGVRVSSIIKEAFKEERRGSGLIFSGIINTQSGINNTNQFIIGEQITKDLNPIHGTIQKLATRGAGAQGDLLTLCEDKCFRILANKDALFNADGNPQLTASTNVLGQVIPFAGEYGISKNPESFASFGFRSYFTDKSRGVILRLSADGLTDISAKGMGTFLENKLLAASGNLIGSYDKSTSSYNIAIGNESYSFKESVDGWPTILSYVPESALSLDNIYYTFKNGELYKHTNTTRCNFYGTQYTSTVESILNDAPSKIKNFKTVYYEGDAGWLCEVETDQNTGFVKTSTKGKWGDNDDVTLITPVASTATDKEGIFYGWIRGNELDPSSSTAVGKEFAMQGIGNVGTVTEEGGGSTQVMPFTGALNVSLQIGDIIYFVDADNSNTVTKLGPVTNISGTTVKATYTSGNKPVASDFIFFVKDNELNTSGVIGYFAKLKFSINNSGKNELFAVGSETFISS